MSDFRLISPKRRNQTKEVKDYRLHKNDLCEDFKNSCGYCGDNDAFSGGKRFYQIDHFVPKSFEEIDRAEYSNLVYSCFFCNNRKRKDWPTGNINQHNDGIRGYIDPCHDDFPGHFKRNERGDIIPCSQLGDYMHLHLNLGLRRHALIWNLSRFEIRIERLKKLKEKGLLKDHILEYCTLLEKYYEEMMYLRVINNE
ncbi:HNH endonuclease [Methanolobus sp.]|uniref:HNH endonuclease n=1 Tax=Methanolobus sp. TaxID=1874737 RepID=UPI0025E1722E|nr:HNH endonuclease [Methanolobus sp.]